MRGQLYRGRANATFSRSPVVSALTTRVLVLAGTRRCALETSGENKNASSAFRLG